jgi:hypothetical protein
MKQKARKAGNLPATSCCFDFEDRGSCRPRCPTPARSVVGINGSHSNTTSERRRHQAKSPTQIQHFYAMPTTRPRKSRCRLLALLHSGEFGSRSIIVFMPAPNDASGARRVVVGRHPGTIHVARPVADGRRRALGQSLHDTWSRSVRPKLASHPASGANQERNTSRGVRNMPRRPASSLEAAPCD